MTHTTENAPERRTDGGTDSPGESAIPEFVSPDDLEPAADTPGVERRMAFEGVTNVMIQSRVAGDSANDWHHHGDRHAYVYLVQGSVALEYGPAGQQRLEGSAPLFAHVPPGVVHRDVNPADEEQVSVINFVGSGPLVVNVDGPGGDA